MNTPTIRIMLATQRLRFLQIVAKHQDRHRYFITALAGTYEHLGEFTPDQVTMFEEDLRLLELIDDGIQFTQDWKGDLLSLLCDETLINDFVRIDVHQLHAADVHGRIDHSRIALVDLETDVYTCGHLLVDGI